MAFGCETWFPLLARAGYSEILDFPNQVKVFDPYQIQEAARKYFNFDNVVVAKLNPKHR